MGLFQQIVETITYNAPGEWVESGDLNIKRFQVYEQDYEIQCKLSELEGEPVVEIAFMWINKNKEGSLELTNFNKGSLNVISTVANSVAERFPSVSAYFFTSKNDPKRASFYDKIAYRIGRNKNLVVQKHEEGSTVIFALIKPSSDIKLQAFI